MTIFEIFILIAVAIFLFFVWLLIRGAQALCSNLAAIHRLGKDAVHHLDRIGSHLNEGVNRGKETVLPESKCSAHGTVRCDRCSLMPSWAHLTNGRCVGCESYGETGMHWDTCQYRIR